MSDPCEPISAQAVIHAMEALIKKRPEAAGWPVVVLDMEEGIQGDDQSWDGAVTHVEIDTFYAEQGPVISLTAWRGQDGWVDPRRAASGGNAGSPS